MARRVFLRIDTPEELDRAWTHAMHGHGPEGKRCSVYKKVNWHDPNYGMLQRSPYPTEWMNRLYREANGLD